MKTLIVDADNSLAAIGGPRWIEANLGAQPIPMQIGGYPPLMKVLSRLFAVKTVKEVHFGVETEAVRFEPKTDVQAIVVDTITTIGMQERLRLTKQNNALKNKEYAAMDQQDWGNYKNQTHKLLYFLCNAPLTVVVTAHIKTEVDQMGNIKQLPAVQGTSSSEIMRWFDVIGYTSIVDGEYVFSIQNDPRTITKDRLGIFKDKLLDNATALSEIVAAYQEQGMHPKILVLGESGTGKTSLLKSLSQIP